MSEDRYSNIWNNVWEKVKTYNNIDPDQVNAFFSRLVPQAFSEGFLMLTADNSFIKTWIEKNYLHVIKQALEDTYSVPFTVAIEVNPEQEPTLPTPVAPAQSIPAPPKQELVAPIKQNNIASLQDENYVSEYTFDNFVVGSSNQLAYSMALKVAETPGEMQLNPLFIYGKSGLGKTHLLRSIQNYVKEHYPHLHTVYVDTMELVNDYTDAAIRGGGKEFNTFKQRYMEADVVLIDDVQGLQKKDETINMVFQIFKHLTDHGKQLVFSADRAPKHIDIDERYRTRFNQGGTCDIQAPETETKLGIIRNFVEECKHNGVLDFEIGPDIQEYVAQNSSSNIREVKSAITRIIFYCHGVGKTSVTTEEVSNLLRDHFSGGTMKKLSIADIQKAVEQYFSISHAELVGKKRSANISHARQVAMYLCREMIDVSYEHIGKDFNRDHTTVIYSVTTIGEKRKDNRELSEELELIQQTIMEQ